MAEMLANGLTVEQRLEAVEREVADLKRRLAEALVAAKAPETGSWLDKTNGMIAEEDEEAFLQVAEYGRRTRQADMPVDGEEGES